MDRTPSFVEAAGLRTAYYKAGSGPAIVIVHGGSPGASALVNWGQNIEPLAAAGFTVYAYDQPGYGQTDNPDDLSLEYRVKHALALVDALGLKSYHAIGNSQGGYIAARMALADDRVQRMVVVSSATLAPKASEEAEARAREHVQELRSFRPGLENMRELTRKTLFNQSLVTDDLVQLRHEMSIGKNQEAEAKRAAQGGGMKPVTEELRHLDKPVLIFTGRNDRGVALEKMVSLFELLPRAELHVFRDCGHWVQWDQAQRFNEMVIQFLSS